MKTVLIELTNNLSYLIPFLLNEFVILFFALLNALKQANNNLSYSLTYNYITLIILFY